MQRLLPLVLNTPSDTRLAGSDLHDTLKLMRAFLAVLLAEQPGPLTDVQRDLLLTIEEQTSRALASIDDGLP
ncbi:MAG: hypothetical protein ACRD1H_04225 [Vicinamibacterales bacterium]